MAPPCRLNPLNFLATPSFLATPPVVRHGSALPVKPLRNLAAPSFPWATPPVVRHGSALPLKPPRNLAAPSFPWATPPVVRHGSALPVKPLKFPGYAFLLSYAARC